MTSLCFSSARVMSQRYFGDEAARMDVLEEGTRIFLIVLGLKRRPIKKGAIAKGFLGTFAHVT